MTRVAAVDVGTNTILLLVAERRGDQLARVFESCRFVRLGEGLDATGRLADAAVARALDALAACRAEIDAHGADRVAAIGTQALREAANASALLVPAADRLGAPIEVISGEREAELAFAAACRALPGLAGGPLVVADVGGGSTEIIAGDAGGVRARHSVPIGSVRLAERHLRSDPPAPDEVRALIADIDAAFAPIDVPRGAPIVGVAGTATTLAAVELALRTYEPDRVQGQRLGLPTIERQLARYLEVTVAVRRTLPGLEPQRADVIPAGAAIFARLLRRAGADELIVNDRGIRWGLAWELGGCCA
ncbi:MAG: Ppx/GppA family phosphatase [Deltaproteobacteria bacterium]|nr:MAG: Ppx/GppA family phosphatase [Deltaproteobacteria bacterium]